MPERPHAWRLVAPIASRAEAEEAIAAGADELYCGAMTDRWARTFGDDDLLTRRQGRAAHLAGEREMREVARAARESGCPIALTLNGRYTAAQVPQVRDLASIWEAAGGTALIVADPGLLRALARSRSRLACHVSLLAGVFNAEAARFFAGLGAARVILPRDLSISEMEAIASAGPEIEYEAPRRDLPWLDGRLATRELPGGAGAPGQRSLLPVAAASSRPRGHVDRPARVPRGRRGPPRFGPLCAAWVARARGGPSGSSSGSAPWVCSPTG